MANHAPINPPLGGFIAYANVTSTQANNELIDRPGIGDLAHDFITPIKLRPFRHKALQKTTH